MLRVELSLPEWVEREVDFTRSYGTPESRMQLAIELARSNIRHDSGGPFGAAIFSDDGQLLAVGVNRVVPQNCSAAHAEVMAFMQAQARLGSFRLNQDGQRYILATSSQPCAMCYGASFWAGIDALEIGARSEDVMELSEFDEGPLPAACRRRLLKSRDRSCMRPTSTSLLAYCRPGFESECAQELASAGERLGVIGFARTTRGSGFVEYVLPDSSSQQAFSAGVQLANLTFARQLLRVIERIDDLPAKDRLGLLMPVVRSTARRFVDAWIESPDSDAARELAGLCRSLNNALVAAMKRESLIDAASQWRLHVCLVDAQTAFVCGDRACRALAGRHSAPALSRRRTQSLHPQT